MDMKDFVTFDERVTQDRTPRHRQRKELRGVGPLDTTILTSMGGTTVQMCGDSKVAERWINRYFSMEKKYRDKSGGTRQQTMHSW